MALIQRINPVVEDASIPQLTQTAYRKGVFCQDSIFAGTECNATFANGGDNMYTCFYDLDSAFDTVQFSALLTELFKAGTQGKCWRLIRHWYCNPTSQVKLGNNLSRSFNLARCIRQGSVLSPSLFNLVLDPLLSSLKQQSLGLDYFWVFGGTSHPPA